MKHLAPLFVLLAACGPGYATDLTIDTKPITLLVRAPQLGTGDHTASSVTLTEIANGATGLLSRPRDLAFNPRVPDELWTVSFNDDSVLVVHDASKDSRRPVRYKDPFAFHFLEQPSSIAFGADATTIGKPGTFGTCQESRNTYDNMQAHNDFMGPALWSSDLTVFAQSNPHGLGTHLDMLHGSPNCMGIAHEKDNIYWVFGGKRHSGTAAQRQEPIPALVRYDFGQDHGIGADDHSDGRIWQYADNLVKDVPGIPSHLVYEQSTKLLWVADTGNARIATMDTMSGTIGGPLFGQEPLISYDRMIDATVTTFTTDVTLVRPSGLELFEEFVFVSDNQTSIIHAFDKSGVRVNWIETGLPAGALSGMAFGPDGKLYFVDMLGNRVLRIDPK